MTYTYHDAIKDFNQASEAIDRLLAETEGGLLDGLRTKLGVTLPVPSRNVTYIHLKNAPDGYYRDKDGDTWYVHGNQLELRRNGNSGAPDRGFSHWGTKNESLPMYGPYNPITESEATA